MSDNQPEVKELDQPFQCVWCYATATHEIDGNTCCGRHKQTAWVWATAKRANRPSHPAARPRPPEGVTP